MRLHFSGKEKYFAFMNKILTLLSLLSRMEQNSGTETKKLDKLHLNKLLNRQFFTIKEQL